MSQSNHRPEQGRQPQQVRRTQPGGQYPPRRPQPAPYRSAAPARPMPRGRALPYGLGKLALVAVIVVALAFGIQRAWPNGFPVVKANNAGAAGPVTINEIHSSGPIRINEVMSSNRNCLSIADGTSPDWIEIMNVSGNAVNIGGYRLAKSANATNVFAFPDMWLNANECVLVYCDSRLRTNAGEDFHAPFRLSSAGDTLMLFNAADTAVDTLNLPSMARDHSYARVDTARWEKSDAPSPGLANTAENYLQLTQMASDSPVIVTELMSGNKSALADENGQYYDYIKLTNRSGEAVDLSGWYLSDDEVSTRKWRFPDVQIGSGETITVFASKLDRREDPTHLHTNFSLSSEGEFVVLSNSIGRVMDRVEFGLLKADVAYVRQDDGTWMSRPR